MRLLDLFCGAGGAAEGYHRAGFEDITGIDNRPMPRYPFRFIQADALEYLAEHGHEYDVIHASPPCQAYSVTSNLPNVGDYPELIEPIRELLITINKPWIIENVIGAPLKNPVMLCGLMFGLKTLRHRLFETIPYMLAPWHPPHPNGIITKTYGNGQYSSFENGATHITAVGHNFKRIDGVVAFGNTCEWMTREELAEAIPPAYTEYIGKQLISQLAVI